MSRTSSNGRLKLAAALFSALALSACGTLQGVGTDVEAAGASASSVWQSIRSRVESKFSPDQAPVAAAPGSCPPLPTYSPSELLDIAAYMRDPRANASVKRVIANAQRIDEVCSLKSSAKTAG